MHVLAPFGLLWIQTSSVLLKMCLIGCLESILSISRYSLSFKETQGTNSFISSISKLMSLFAAVPSADWKTTSGLFNSKSITVKEREKNSEIHGSPHWWICHGPFPENFFSSGSVSQIKRSAWVGGARWVGYIPLSQWGRKWKAGK